jgi:hypothetical protein
MSLQLPEQPIKPETAQKLEIEAPSKPKSCIFPSRKVDPPSGKSFTLGKCADIDASTLQPLPKLDLKYAPKPDQIRCFNNEDRGRDSKSVSPYKWASDQPDLIIALGQRVNRRVLPSSRVQWTREHNGAPKSSQSLYHSASREKKRLAGRP